MKVKFSLVDEALDTRVFPDDDLEYPAKLVCFFRLTSGEGDDRATDPTFSVLAHCAEWQRLSSETYKRKTLLTRSWNYQVTNTQEPRPKYTVLGTVEEPDIVGQIFGIEENPGFYETYPTYESRRFIVLSDMRTDWPQVFMSGDFVVN